MRCKTTCIHLFLLPYHRHYTHHRPRHRPLNPSERFHRAETIALHLVYLSGVLTTVTVPGTWLTGPAPSRLTPLIGTADSRRPQRAPALAAAVNASMSATIPTTTTPRTSEHRMGTERTNTQTSGLEQQSASPRRTSSPPSGASTTPQPTSTVFSFNVNGITFEHDTDSGAVVFNDIAEIVIALPQRTRPEHKGDSIATLNFHTSFQARMHVVGAHSACNLGYRTKVTSLRQATGITISELTDLATASSPNPKAARVRIRLSFPANMMLLACFGDGKDFLLNDSTISTAVFGPKGTNDTRVCPTDPRRDENGFVLPGDPTAHSGPRANRDPEIADSDAVFNAEEFVFSSRTAYGFQDTGGMSDDDQPLMVGRTTQSTLCLNIAAANRMPGQPQSGSHKGRPGGSQDDQTRLLKIQSQPLSSSSSTSGIPEPVSVVDSSPPRRSGRTRLSTFRNSSAPTPIQTNLHHERGPDGKFVPRSVSGSGASGSRRQVRSVSQRSGHQESQGMDDEIPDAVVGGRSRQSSAGRRRSGLEAEVESLLYAHNKFPKGKTQSPRPVGARKTRNSGGYTGFDV